MVVTASDIKAILSNKLEAIHVEVTDDSDGCGAKFTVLVVSDKFQGKSLLQRHRGGLLSIRKAGQVISCLEQQCGRRPVSLKEHVICLVQEKSYVRLEAVRIAPLNRVLFLPRLVNQALSEQLKSIHAFSQKTITKEEWERAK